MKAVILVGGYGTRLRPLTYSKCKAMMPVLNKPFLEHVFYYLRRHQVDEIVLAMGYLPDQIQQYFGDGSSFHVKLSYVVENIPLGTAGAVKNGEEHLDDEAFFVFNGDIFTDIDLSAMLDLHRQRMAKATIALTPVEDVSQFGVVETDPQGRVQRFVEKPPPGETASNMINAGIYILERDVLDDVPTNTHYMFEHHLFPKLLESGRPVYGFPSDAYWIDMGTPQKYLALQRDLMDSKGTMDLCIDESAWGLTGPTAQVEGVVVVGDDCSIGNGVQIKGPTVLGPGCRIMDGAIVEASVLWGNVEVGPQAKLSDCIMGDDCIIGEGCQLRKGTVLGSHTVVRGLS